MERYIYNEETFERSLKQKVDEYKMYPSNKVWGNIQSKLKNNNPSINYKSIGLTVILLTCFSIYLSNHQNTYQKNTLIVLSNYNNSLASAPEQLRTATIQPVKKAVKKIFHKHTTTVNSQPAVLVEQSLFSETPVTQTEYVKNIHTSEIIPDNLNSTVEATEQSIIKTVTNHYLRSQNNMAPVIQQEPEQKLTALNPLSTTTEISAPEETASSKTDAELNYEVKIPVVLRKKELKKIVLYVTPSSSYRVLYADNKFTFGNFPQLDPENEVTHTPSLGVEAGASILFPVTKRIKFRTGVQFNLTRYKVNAFKAIPQLTTVRLNYSTTQRLTVLDNNNGYITRNVQNETYQFSVPLGFEVNLAGSKKVTWELGANLQPSFLLKASGYLLTNDYKNYIKAPDLMSHINLNTGLETFIRWDAGKFQLQAGPQLRYQLFSNAREVYPVKEHLVDYGFRLGIIKPIR